MIYSLDGIDGNAFSVISYVKSAMIETGFSYDDISNYVYSATYVKTYLEMLNKTAVFNIQKFLIANNIKF